MFSSFSCTALWVSLYKTAKPDKRDSRGEDEADDDDDEEDDANCPSEQDEDDGSMIWLDILMCRNQRGPFSFYSLYSRQAHHRPALPCPNRTRPDPLYPLTETETQPP